jgi:CRP-like cAMP-binding protein
MVIIVEIFDNFDKKSKYKKEFFTNELIFNAHTLCSSICLIKRGKIGLICKNKLIKTYNQYSIIGLDIIFSDNPFYDFDYIALELVSLDFISKDSLFNELKNPIFSLQLLSYYSNKLIECEKYIRLLSYKNEKEKVENYFYNYYKNKSSTSFVIDLTKAELANYLNIEKKVLSKIIKELIDNKIIANQNKLYTIINLDYFEQK